MRKHQLNRGRFPQRAASAFDEWAPTYENDVTRMFAGRGYSYSQLADTVVGFLSVDAPPRGVILEVGTGPGVLGVEVHRRLPDLPLLGLDISQEMLKRAQAKHAYAQLSRASAVSLPYAGGSFRGVFTAFVFHSVWNQDLAFQEVHRVLAKDGRAVVVDLFPARRSTIVSAALGLIHSLLYEFGALARYSPVCAYRARAQRVGLDVLAERRLGHDRKYQHVLLAMKKK